MSLNQNKLKVIRVIDPVIDLVKDREYGAIDAGSEITYQQFNSNSSINSSNITVVCNPPNMNTVIHPQVYIEAPITVTFSGNTGTSTGLFTASYGITDAPRAFPLSQSMQSLNALWNGYSINTNLSEYYSAFLRYNNEFLEQDREFSTCPSMLDQSQTYLELLGSVRNPLNGYADNQMQSARGAFPIVINSQSPTAANITFRTIEPLMLSPLYYSKTGISGISTLTINMVLANLNRVWSQMSTSLMTITSVSIGLVSILFRYHSVKELDVIPKELTYPFHNVQQITADTSGSVAAGGVVDLTLNATNLQSIPQRIYICARKQTGQLTSQDPDVFAKINNISVQWKNRSGLLASARESNLYQMSRIAGLNVSWDQWLQKTGAVLCLEPAKVIGFNDLFSVGSLDNPQFSIRVNFTNISSNAQPMTLYAFVVYEGLFNVQYGQCSTTITPLSKEDVLDAEVSREERLARKATNWFGGDFVSDIGKFVKKVEPYVKTGLDIAKIVGGKRNARALVKGRALLGGSTITRDQLLENLVDD